MYLISGEPGTGKTTIGLHFLEEGLANDETGLFIHGEESASEILQNAAQFNIDISSAEFLDLGPESTFFSEHLSFDLVEPSAVEGQRYTQAIHEAIQDVNPSRVVIDPITQLRHIEPSEYQYQKRVLSFIRFLKEHGITVLATETIHSPRMSNGELRSLSDGVVELTRTTQGRRIEVLKNRGKGQVSRDHGLEIRSNGIEVFPRIRTEPTDTVFNPTPLRSGVPALDDLLNGGIERGTVTFISGPPGVGKTTTGSQYLIQAAKDKHNAAIYLFEERIETYLHRCRSIGSPIDEVRDNGFLSVQVIDPLTLSAEEFAQMVRREVESESAEIVMIDGFGGYISAIQGEKEDLKRDLHALTRYLVNLEVSVFVTDSVHQITGISTATSANLSPIADNIMFLSFVESRGALRKVIGVLKKRAGGFEHSLREFEITSNGITVGEPMTGYTGILSGNTEMWQTRGQESDSE
jgi:circadian clock protein KaiC